MVRNPVVFAPCTVIVPPGTKSSVEAALVPLFRVMPFACLRSSEPTFRRDLSAAPVNVMPAPAVSLFVLKSIVPAFVRFPPTDTTCPVWAPFSPDWKVPPPATLRSPPRVRVLAVISSYCRMPVLPTIRLSATAAVSMITVQPVPIVTLSAAVGTPPDHVPGELQLPPGATHAMSPRGANVEEPRVRPRRRSRALRMPRVGGAAEARGRAARAAARTARAGPAAFDVLAMGPTCADRTAGTAIEAAGCELVLVPASATGTIPSATSPTTNRQRRTLPRDVRGQLGAA